MARLLNCFHYVKLGNILKRLSQRFYLGGSDKDILIQKFQEHETSVSSLTSMPVKRQQPSVCSIIVGILEELEM